MAFIIKLIIVVSILAITLLSGCVEQYEPEPPESMRIYCTPEQRGQVCTQEYEPVCGYVKVYCLRGPCPLIATEFSNSCMACQQSNIVYYIGEPCSVCCGGK